MAEEGRGEPVSHEKALELYEKAALAGDAEAQLAYADKLEEGEGLDCPDHDQAFVFYERAALNGVGEAQQALGALISVDIRCEIRCPYEHHNRLRHAHRTTRIMLAPSRKRPR